MVARLGVPNVRALELGAVGIAMPDKEGGRGALNASPSAKQLDWSCGDGRSVAMLQSSFDDVVPQVFTQAT